MKILTVLVLILVSVLLVISYTCLPAEIKQTSEEKPIEASNQPNTTVNSDASPTKSNAKTGSNEVRRAGESAPEGNSNSTDEAVPNGALVETPSEQSTSQASGNDAASVSVPPPDGRVYSGGEEPYAYIPTYSPKDRLPIVPLPPDQ